MKNTMKLSLACLMILGTAAAPALAGQTSTTMSVSVNVGSGCTASTAQNVGFGQYDYTSGSADLANGAINVVCNKGATGTIDIDDGVNNSNSTSGAQRKMKDANGDTINYTLSTSAGGPSWTYGGASDLSLAGYGSFGNQQYTVYGSIPPGQNVPVGSYSDTVTIYINYN